MWPSHAHLAALQVIASPNTMSFDWLDAKAEQDDLDYPAPPLFLLTILLKC